MDRMLKASKNNRGLHEMLSKRHPDKYRRAVFVASNYQAAVQMFDRLVLTGFPKKDIFLVGKKIQDTAIEESIFWDFGNGGIQKTSIDQALMRVLWKRSSGFELGWDIGMWGGCVVGILAGLSCETWLSQGQASLLLFSLVFIVVNVFLTIFGGMFGAYIGYKTDQIRIKYIFNKIVQGKYLVIVFGQEDVIRRIQRCLR